MTRDASAADPGWVVVGPTAVGKSGVAMCLARQLGGEIITVDSMQVYRGLDIGTDKPSPSDRALIPHHLVDVVSLAESFDAARFVRLARAAAADIRGRNRAVISSGGTGLYLKAWVEGLGHAPPADPELRLALEQMPLAELLEELRRRDPVAYERIDRRNPRRVIRAVEVLRLAGEPLASQRATWRPVEEAPEPRPGYFGLVRPAASLARRIEARVERMFAEGLVEETRALLEAGLRSNATACQAIGYRQVMEMLDGQRSCAETIDLVKRRTRQLARRQLTWFRRQTPVTWLEVGDDEPDASVVDRILRRRGQT